MCRRWPVHRGSSAGGAYRTTGERRHWHQEYPGPRGQRQSGPVSVQSGSTLGVRRVAAPPEAGHPPGGSARQLGPLRREAQRVGESGRAQSGIRHAPQRQGGGREAAGEQTPALAYSDTHVLHLPGAFRGLLCCAQRLTPAVPLTRHTTGALPTRERESLLAARHRNQGSKQQCLCTSGGHQLRRGHRRFSSAPIYCMRGQGRAGAMRSLSHWGMQLRCRQQSQCPLGRVWEGTPRGEGVGAPGSTRDLRLCCIWKARRRAAGWEGWEGALCIPPPLCAL